MNPSILISGDSKQPLQTPSRITDNDSTTCVSFNASTGEHGPWYTNFRVAMKLGAANRVFLVGYELGCNQPDVRLYVTALHNPGSWSGVAQVCSFKKHVTGTPETCRYRCKCSSTCDWLQIVRRPMTPISPSWTLCSICKL